jgi:hypothetical protein
MHMNDPMTRVVCSVVPMRSAWKMRTSESRGSRLMPPDALSLRWRSSQTGLSGTRARIHNVKSAGKTQTQNMTRHARSGSSLKRG